MINVNELSKDELRDKLAHLRPGDATRTVDEITIRRCRDHPGYEFIGNGMHRYSTPDSAMNELLGRSARSAHPQSLGGAIRYHSAEAALDVLETGKAVSGKHYAPNQIDAKAAERAVSVVTKIKVVEDSGAIGMLERIIKNGTLPSYKSRAKLALASLQKGDVGVARGHIEALVTHAERNGASRDAGLATDALLAVRRSYPDEASKPIPTDERFTIRKTSDGHQLFDGKRAHGKAFSNHSEAQSRQRFLNRRARQQAGADEIDAQESGEPIVRKKAEASS